MVSSTCFTYLPATKECKHDQNTNKVKAQSFLVLNISATDAAQSFCRCVFMFIDIRSNELPLIVTTVCFHCCSLNAKSEFQVWTSTHPLPLIQFKLDLKINVFNSGYNKNAKLFILTYFPTFYFKPLSISKVICFLADSKPACWHTILELQ